MSALAIAPFSDLGAFGAVAALLFGLVIGSFLNVLVHRLPRGESVVRPGSHCPACGAPVRGRDNIPLVSWVLLRARCRDCRAPISPLYPLVELVNGALWSLCFLRAPSYPDFLAFVFLVSACLSLLLIDAEFQLLPDAITLTGIAVGIALSFFSAVRTPLSAALGAALGAGGLFAVAFVYERIAGQEGMGLGDVKMLGMIGAFLGPSGVLVTVLLSSVAGSAVGLGLMAARRGSMKMALPFGVFLSLGAVAALFFGEPLVAQYRGLFP
jgi:leader peptidase (prepilin peptidase)/N-methyltransferase